MDGCVCWRAARLLLQSAQKIATSIILNLLYSLDEILKQAKKEGVTPEADTPIKLEDHVYLVLLKDPDGVFVELIGDYSNAD